MIDKEKQSQLKYSKKQRRKRFGKWVSMDMYHKAKKSSKPVGGMVENAPKVMSNSDRRRLGLEQDKELPDYQTS